MSMGSLSKVKAKVSVISLIYQSPTLADWVYGSVQKFTPMIGRGEAEFLFVANDPTPTLLEHLVERGYPHIVNLNRRQSDEELFHLGYAAPEHMSRVYRGYNEGVKHARTDYVVLINSDNFVSPDWLENLMKYSDRSRVVSSMLVERNHPTFSVFPGALHGEFGGSAHAFDERGFLAFAARVKKTGLEKGGAFMPTLFHRDVVIEAGLYPAGNVAGMSFDHVARFGDEAFFDVLETLGVSHFTALDSIVYHLKEGERAERASASRVASGASVGESAFGERLTAATAYPTRPAIEYIRDSMVPVKRHTALVDALVVDSGDAPSTRTMRQLVESGLLAAEQISVFETEIARRQQAQILEEQARKVRTQVMRVVGARRTDTVMRALRSMSWLTGPVRRRLAARRGNHRPS